MGVRPPICCSDCCGVISMPSASISPQTPLPAWALPKNCSRECPLGGVPLWGFDQGIPQRFGPTGHVLYHPVAVLLFILVHALAHVGSAMLEHGVEKAGQFVCRGGDGFGGAHPGFHP